MRCNMERAYFHLGNFRPQRCRETAEYTCKNCKRNYCKTCSYFSKSNYICYECERRVTVTDIDKDLDTVIWSNESVKRLS